MNKYIFIFLIFKKLYLKIYNSIFLFCICISLLWAVANFYNHTTKISQRDSQIIDVYLKVITVTLPVSFICQI